MMVLKKALLVILSLVVGISCLSAAEKVKLNLSIGGMLDTVSSGGAGMLSFGAGADVPLSDTVFLAPELNLYVVFGGGGGLIPGAMVNYKIPNSDFFVGAGAIAGFVYMPKFNIGYYGDNLKFSIYSIGFALFGVNLGFCF